MDFKDNLKRIRADRGITQKSLGASIGVTPVTVGNWERGERQPSFKLLLQLAAILGVSADELLGNPSTSRHTFDMDTAALAKKYERLDPHGRELVRTVCSLEYERILHSERTICSARPEQARRASRNRFLPRFISPPAAGFGAPLEGEDFEMIRVDDNTPEDADYAVCISGDSMEPYIRDGDMVFVKETDNLADGDVGIFSVNGEMLCKQYHVDEERTLHLLSANPARADASVHIPHDSGYTVRCCGKVLLDCDVPLP